MKIISGGQVGVDIAALRAAKEVGFETGGWIPKGFRTKYGPKPEYAELYGLKETADFAYPKRTYMNVLEGDGTLRIAENWKSRGEICTLNAIKAYEKPYYDVFYKDVSRDDKWFLHHNWFYQWAIKNNIKTLNVAGNATKEYEEPIFKFLVALFNTCGGI